MICSPALGIFSRDPRVPLYFPLSFLGEVEKQSETKPGLAGGSGFKSSCFLLPSERRPGAQALLTTSRATSRPR